LASNPIFAINANSAQCSPLTIDNREEGNGMGPLTIILDALVAGAAAAGKDTVVQGVEELKIFCQKNTKFKLRA
jgi:hypothetical protein